MSDAVLQDLIVRMAADPAFADQVRSNPSLLDGYDLTADERGSLSALTGDTGSGVEGLAARQSKSSLFFTGMPHDVGAHAAPSHIDLGGHHPGPGGEHSISSGGDRAVHDISHDKFIQHDKWTPVGDKHFTGPVHQDKWLPVGDKAHIDAGHVKLDPNILGQKDHGPVLDVGHQKVFDAGVKHQFEPGVKVEGGGAQVGGGISLGGGHVQTPHGPEHIGGGFEVGAKVHPGDAQGLNPQPLPPMPGEHGAFTGGTHGTQEVLIGLNQGAKIQPQGEFTGGVHPGQDVSLNPQPFPPAPGGHAGIVDGSSHLNTEITGGVKIEHEGAPPGGAELNGDG